MKAEPRPSSFRARGGFLELSRARIMGVVNVTPDSFYDGGWHATAESAVSHALKLAEQGAAILDVGGESTRPGSAPVSADQELGRVIPVIEALAARRAAWISVDTSKAAVASEALSAGAHIVNDVSALSDPDMAGLCAREGAGVVLMHMRGTPGTMQQDPRYEDVAGDVAKYLEGRARTAAGAGIARESIMIDPGIGFGKTPEHNLALLRELDRLRATGYPVLVGPSRKSFIGKVLDRSIEQRLAGTLAVAAWCVARGVSVLRMHDVAEAADVARMIEAIRYATGQGPGRD